MTLLEAVDVRHSVRHYQNKPLPQKTINILQTKIEECNRNGNLHIQLVLNENKGFNGIMAYGRFSGVENYIVMAGKKSDSLDERIGYYGEQLVLLAQQLNLGTCWAGLSYSKVKRAYNLGKDEKIACMISLGYSADAGRNLRRKSIKDVSNADVFTPVWFLKGVEAALKAPTAVNQQKFFFEYIKPGSNGSHKVKAKRLFSFIGYTKIDLGIAKLHFEIGAGKENFEWI